MRCKVASIMSRRGDFAAGKMLSQGLPDRGEVTCDDIEQVLKDLSMGFEQKAPAYAPIFAALKGADPATVDALGLPSHVGTVLKKCDGGLAVFDYTLFTCDQVKGKASAAPAPLKAIGQDVDEGLLVVDTTSGALYSFDDGVKGAEVAPSFGVYLERFRDALISGKVEWADGWVQLG